MYIEHKPIKHRNWAILRPICLKPPSVTTNVVGLQTDDAGNSSAHMARVVGLQTDAVVVTETLLTRRKGITFFRLFSYNF